MTAPRPQSTPGTPRPGSLPGESGSSPASFTHAPATVANPRSCPACGGRYPVDFKVCPHDATPLEDGPADSSDPIIGQQLGGNYEVLRVIGEGGMGRVYEARHLRLAKKRFAIKMLHHELSRQPEVVSRFQREAEASSALAHPNVVGVFDVNVAPDGRPYLVAELLEGEQLGDHLDRVGKLSVREAVAVVRQVCRALSVAHEAGIVHRDVKPENVFLVEGDGPVKVLDFGISKLDDNASLTKTGMVMGTPDYMAPEQARGDRVDARADVYAVGAILYRAVTGRKPFEGLDPMQTLTAALVTQPPRPTTLLTSLPIELEMIIQRAMAKDPGERYQTMRELDEALAAFEGEAPAPPVSSGDTIDVQGRTILSRPDRVQTSPGIERVAPATSVKLARPGVAFFTGLGFVWLLVNLVVAVGSLVRLFRGADLTPTETVLVPAGVLAALVTPLVLWIRHVGREIWPSTPRSVDVVSRLRRTVLYSAAAYALTTLFIHLLEAVVNQNSAGLSRAGWALVAFQAALIVAVVTWLTTRAKRRT